MVLFIGVKVEDTFTLCVWHDADYSFRSITLHVGSL